MGFIISESGFEMTPGSREVDTPGIWRQDETMNTVGDAFSSAFATAMDAAPSPEERQKNREKRREARKLKLRGKEKAIGKRSISAYNAGNTKKGDRLFKRTTRINKRIKRIK